MEQELNYDYFVIGGGSGGLASAKEAAQYGIKVGLADFVKPSPIGSKWGIGGTCVNVGCIPKKLMHFSALWGESQESQQLSGWQIQAKNEHNWNVLVGGVQGYIKKLNWGYKVELEEKNIDYHNALATVVDKNKIELAFKDGTKLYAKAKYILIAVGGRPTYLPEIKDSDKLVITSDDLFSLKKPPGKTLIVGASYIALECGGLLAGLGYDVTILVRSILLRGFDQEIANKIGEHMEKHGVKFIREAIPSDIKLAENNQKKVTWISAQDKKILGEGLFDTVLLAIGRNADTTKLGLDKIGVQLAKNGKIMCKEDDSTSVQNIFAIGDCVDTRLELTPTAIMAGRLLARRLFNNSQTLMNYKFVPTTVFTPLEYGACGYSEEEAIEKFKQENIKVYFTSFTPLEYAFSKKKKDDQGYAKLICLIPENEKVIGFHYLGLHAGEVTQGYAVAVKAGLTKKHFEDTVAIHPTYAEEIINMKFEKGKDASSKKGGC